MKKLITLIFILLHLQLFAQWTATSGPNGAGTISSLAVNDTGVYAGTETAGVFLSADQGVTWTAMDSGLTNMNDVRSLVSNDSTLFAGMYNSLSGPAIFKSTDNGISWNPTTVQFMFVLSMAQSGSLIMAGTWYGVVYSVNNGATWLSSSTGLPGNASVCGLAFSLTKVFTGVCSSSSGGTGVFYSTNGGSTWNAFNTGLTSTVVNSLAVYGSDVLAGTQGGGIFRSPVSSANWTAVNTGLGNQIVKKLFVTGNSIFAGTTSGIYFSYNGGSSWVDISTGLPAATKVYSIAADSTYLYIGTDSLVYKRPLTQVITHAAEINPLASSVNVYPNPSTGEIFFEGEGMSGVSSVEILNSLLQVVLKEDAITGNRLKLSLKDLESGIYFARLTGKDSTGIFKIVKQD